MHSTLNHKPGDDPHDVVVVAPDAVKVAPSDEELADLLHQAARYRVDPQTRAADFAADPKIPPVDTTFRPAAVGDVEAPSWKGSIGRGALRAVTALLVAGCIGLATFSWRTWGDTAEKKVARWMTEVVMTASMAPENPAPAAPATPAVVQADTANATAPPPAASAQGAAEAVAPPVAASPDSAQLLQSMARDLASLAQEVEQLKANIGQLKASQQQMSRDMAKASEQNSKPRIATAPPRPAAARTPKPVPPPVQVVAPPPPPVQTAAPAPVGVPYYAPRQGEYAPRTIEPPPPAAAERLSDPELASVPRPPMPVR